MQVVTFLILLLLRIIVGVVALLLADLAIHFAPLPISSPGRSGDSALNSDDWFNTHMYHRWTGVWACFILQLMICASIDYVTSGLPRFAGLPVIARAIGCSAVLLVITLIVVILRKSNEEPMGYPFETEFKRSPSWGEFNITWAEIFFLSPLFVSEFLQDRLRIGR